jgi:hypothetical protein
VQLKLVVLDSGTSEKQRSLLLAAHGFTGYIIWKKVEQQAHSRTTCQPNTRTSDNSDYTALSHSALAGLITAANYKKCCAKHRTAVPDKLHLMVKLEKLLNCKTQTQLTHPVAAATASAAVFLLFALPATTKEVRRALVSA